MKVGFYCRTSTGSFTCVIPDEGQKLHDFFAAEQENAAKKIVKQRLLPLSGRHNFLSWA